MTAKSWTFVGIALLAGLFLGYMLVPPPLPAYNKITILVEDPTNRLNIAPAKGDKIKWINQADGSDVGVAFSTDSPCEVPTDPNDKSCKIKVAKGHFRYHCSDGVTCEDPGIDPRNQARVTPEGGNGFKTDVYKMLGSKNYPDNSSETAPVPPGGNTTGVPSPPHGSLASRAARNAVTPPAPPDSVYAVITCSNNAPVVSWDPPTPGSAVHDGETILWTGGSYDFTVGGFTTKGAPVQLCDPPNSSIDQGHTKCKVKKDLNQTPSYPVDYTVSITGCGSISSTLTVNPPPQH
jgi:hypothetical protein